MSIITGGKVIEHAIQRGSPDNAVYVGGQQYATIQAALDAALAGATVKVGPGTYQEDVTWPSLNNIVLAAEIPGTVVIEAVTLFAVKINPTVQTSTFNATIQGIDLSHGENQFGLKVDNAATARRINIYLNDVNIESENVTDHAIDVDRSGGAGDAIRLYANGRNHTIEGLVDFITESTDDRVRFNGYRLMGGVTITGNVVMEVTYENCGILTSGESYGTGNVSSHFACWNETDANPNVYTLIADDANTSH